MIPHTIIAIFIIGSTVSIGLRRNSVAQPDELPFLKSLTGYSLRGHGMNYATHAKVTVIGKENINWRWLGKQKKNGIVIRWKPFLGYPPPRTAPRWLKVFWVLGNNNNRVPTTRVPPRSTFNEGSFRTWEGNQLGRSKRGRPHVVVVPMIDIYREKYLLRSAKQWRVGKVLGRVPAGWTPAMKTIIDNADNGNYKKRLSTPDIDDRRSKSFPYKVQNINIPEKERNARVLSRPFAFQMHYNELQKFRPFTDFDQVTHCFARGVCVCVCVSFL